ncbi:MULTISPECIES: SAM-dependent methyltransferase [Nocardia]|uniref:SAM-dependent methyltransferase n=1 Tax=Nocardia TaxID=1817 RepID=UPI002456506D|nr:MULTISPECIES: SAM-dependent methyltransferase [Nocardia]
MSDRKRQPHDSRPALDPHRAHCGRIHDVLLAAGKDAYMVDREAGQELIAQARAVQVAARAARLFLLRAVQHLAAKRGVSQIVELGSGYPCPPNLHEVARTAIPAARTLYVDNDPVVAAHGNALLADEQTDFAYADLTDTDTIVREIAKTMNPSKPLAICLGFVAEFLADPRALVTAVAAAAPAGSYVVLSHIGADIDTDAVERAAEIYRRYDISFWPRTRAEIAEILADYELIEPGLVPPDQWRPDTDLDRRHVACLQWKPLPATETCCYAAVGRLR